MIAHAMKTRPTMGRRQGTALFLAVSLLALFSVLGASYVRRMTLEKEASDLYVRSLRAELIAQAGVNSGLSVIHEANGKGVIPAVSHLFSYGTYGHVQGTPHETPRALDHYNAQARVDIAPLSLEAWEARYPGGPAWPGENRSYRIVSRAEFSRAGAGMMRPLARHAVEAIALAQADCCEIVAWSTLHEE